MSVLTTKPESNYFVAVDLSYKSQVFKLCMKKIIRELSSQVGNGKYESRPLEYI